MAGDPLSLALELDRRVALRAAREAIQIPEGWVGLEPALPDVYFLNAVRITEPMAPEFGAREVIALCDHWLGHLGHRLVRIDDSDLARRADQPMAAAGFRRDRTLFMAIDGPAPDRPADSRAREITDAEMEALMLAVYGEDGSPGLTARLVAAQSATRARTPALCFGAGEEGELQAMCTLYLDEDVGGVRVAMVESVGTLRSHRQRGLGNAVVGAALRAAADWGAELTTVPADADDWPQVMYSKLGFEPLGTQTGFTLRRVAGRVGTCETEPDD